MLTNAIVKGAVRALKEEGDAILECAERMVRDPESFSRIIKLMKKCLDKGGKIVVTGVGKSGKVGEKIVATLQSTGSLAVFLHPTEGLHGDLGIVQTKDVVLALSYTGNTEELLRIVPSFKERKVILIGLGGNKNSLLAQQCDAWLDGYVKSEVCSDVPAPTSSTTVALALGDAIAISLMQCRVFEAHHFALNHPGGSLGRKLTLKVKDVMHHVDEIPLASQDTSVSEILALSMSKGFGSVLVLDETGESIIGIISDGDMRRALEYREQIFQLTAKDIMTSEPVVCYIENMANEALVLMNERDPRIDALPVIDKSKKLRGMITAEQLSKTF